MAFEESSRFTCCYKIWPIDCFACSRLCKKWLLKAYLVYLSSFSYCCKSVFWGPRWYLVLPALVILFFLCPFPALLGVTAYIYSTTTYLGYISSITVKKPDILALCPGMTFMLPTSSSLYYWLKSANLYTS